MTQIDVPAAIGIGSGFASAAAKLLRNGNREHFLRTLLKLNYFLIFFFSWMPIYFAVNYFGWQTTHMWWHADSVTAYPWFVPTLLVCIFACANAGFLVGYRLIRGGHIWANRVIYGVALLLNLFWLVWYYPSTMRLGTYSNWRSAAWIYEDTEFLRAFLFNITLFLGAFLAFIVHLKRRTADGQDRSGAGNVRESAVPLKKTG